MKSKYDATMSFKFVVDSDAHKHVYTYDRVTGYVTGGPLSNPVEYTPSRVNEFLWNGGWRVVSVEPVDDDFPRGGVYAKLAEGCKVFVVGQTTKPDTWAVESSSGQLLKIKQIHLLEISDDDDKAFAIAEDLKISFNQAMNMVKKGYSKQ